MIKTAMTLIAILYLTPVARPIMLDEIAISSLDITTQNTILAATTEIQPTVSKRTIETEEIEEINFTEMKVPKNNAFKSYMSWKAITDKTSDQYKFQQVCYTDSTTGIRMYDNRYCIAVGTGYTTTIGTYIDIILENGNTIECVVADIKDNKDTEKTNRQHIVDNSVTEFIVDLKRLDSTARLMGDISYVTGGKFKGEIENLIVYENEINY